jgi:hypothetical protein
LQFAMIDAEARATVAQALSEAREARRKRDEAWDERDDAIKARHACQLEMQILKGEIDKSKAAVSFDVLDFNHL